MFDGNTSASASRRAAVQEIRTTALPNEMGGFMDILSGNYCLKSKPEVY
jgi:hypothetical protein